MTPNALAPLFAWTWLKNTGGEVSQKLLDIAHRHGWDPNALACIIQIESGGDPQARNRDSGATGMIQWMPSTAKLYGTTTADIFKMKQVEQLDLAERYWQDVFPSPPRLVGDYYLGNFYPKAIGQADDYVIAREGEKAYDWNKTLDVSKDGILTAGDARSVFESRYQAKSGSPLVIPPVTKPRKRTLGWLILGGLAVFGGVKAYQWYHRQKPVRGTRGVEAYGEET